MTVGVRRTCAGCGAVYEVFKHKLIMRDKDSIDCDVCGQELISWNGGVMYSTKLIKRGKSTKG